MHLVRIAIVGLIVAALSGCVSPLAVGSGSPGPSATPLGSNPNEDPVISSAMLPNLTTSEVCLLLTPVEATSLLGLPLEEPPNGMTEGGQATDCVYQAGAIVVAGDYLKVEFNRLGFSGQATMVNLHRGAHTLKVGGFEAIGADAQTDPVVEEAVLSIKLAKEGRDPALWIEAPTSAIARQAAVLILPRLAALARG